MGATLIAVLILGAAFDGMTDETKPPEESPSESRIFTERAVFCPPNGDNTDGTVHLAASGSGDAPLTAGLESSEDEPQNLGSRALFEDTADLPVGIVGYGARLSASASTTYREPLTGLGSARCSEEAATEWFFPQGSVELGHDERLVLYNPFPDEAVVRVTFYTPDGPRSKANLADIAIPSGDVNTLRMNKFILQEDVLGTQITSVRGRFVAWKVVFAEPEGRPSGATLTLGATETAPQWFFPTGASGRGIEERITILNPSDEVALVDVSLITDKRPLPARGLVGLEVQAGSTKEVSLSKALDDRDVGALSAQVRSTNGVEVIAERAVWYDTATFNGYASEIGASAPYTSLWLGPPAAQPSSDTVILLNVGAEEAEIDVELRRASGAPLRPGALQDLRIPTGGRGRIELSRWAEEEQVVALITSTTPIVAERIAYSGSTDDVATLMATPLP
jgi:hypothetical protein